MELENIIYPGFNKTLSELNALSKVKKKSWEIVDLTEIEWVRDVLRHRVEEIGSYDIKFRKPTEEEIQAVIDDNDIYHLRMERNIKLQETDWLVISEKITDAEKTWRENLRKIPQDYTTEEQYDLLLARDEQGNLTHSIWSKP